MGHSGNGLKTINSNLGVRDLIFRKEAFKSDSIAVEIVLNEKYNPINDFEFVFILLVL